MEDLRLVTTEEFNGVDCNFYKADSNMWMTRGQIGKALGYHNPRIAIGKIHTAHRDRLDPLSVDTNLVSTDGKEYSTYIYNERGIFEICRWSRQPKANEFMDWVWDIIEAYRHGEFQRKPRETAITPVEKFLDGMQNMFLEMREENKIFKDTVLKILESQQGQEVQKPVEKLEAQEKTVNQVKTKAAVKPVVKIENPRLDTWKFEIGTKAAYIVFNGNEYKTKGKVFSACYSKMKNVYGICWSQENKEYRRAFGLESQRGRLSTLDVVFNDENLKDLFDSILDGIYENTKRKAIKKNTGTNPEKDWQYYKEKIQKLCEQTGNKSLGGSSIYSGIIRKMDVDWSKYETNKKKTELVRKYPELFAEFSKTADKYLEEKLNEY